MNSARIGLDSPVFAGRLRDFGKQRGYARRPVPAVRARGIADIFAVPQSSSLPSGSPASQKVRAPRAVALPPAQPRQKKSTVTIRRTAVNPLARRRRVTKKSNKVLLSLAVVLFIFGLAVAGVGLRTNKQVQAQAAAQAQQNQGGTTDSSAPDESEPAAAAVGSYQVDPTLPRLITIPSLGVQARIQRQGVTKNGALQAPGNIFNAGWYEGSSKPGDGGAVLVDGHVAGPTKHGVFYNLKNIKAGAVIEIERGDGQKFNYKVVKTQSFDNDQVDMASALVPIVTGKAGLNLITCTGTISGSHYEQRLVVYATQI